MRKIILEAFTVALLISTVITPFASATQLSSAEIQPEQTTLSVSFNWFKFLIVGNNINFTAKVSGGTSPYAYAWDFGDGTTTTVSTPTAFHTYLLQGNYTVTVTVTDSSVPADTGFSSRNVTVLSWPANWNGWLIHHNITYSDGVELWDVTYKGRLVINDARVTGVRVRYKDNFCSFYDEFNSGYTDVGIFEYSSSGSDHYLQIRTMSVDRPFSLVGGYYYQQVWRFFASGRWEGEVWLENGGGCGADHSYEPRWRFDLALGNNAHEFMGQYTPAGVWRNLIWEGNYTDNGFRDGTHNGTQWRFNGNGASYYISTRTIEAIPVQITNPNQAYPSMPGRVYLVKNKPNEVELFPGAMSTIEDPKMWMNNGELAFSNDLAFWFLGYAWVHAPLAHVDGAPANTVTVSFYPYGL